MINGGRLRTATTFDGVELVDLWALLFDEDNVITLTGHGGRGYGTALVLDVLDWARSIDADRVDLSATT